MAIGLFFLGHDGFLGSDFTLYWSGDRRDHPASGLHTARHPAGL